MIPRPILLTEALGTGVLPAVIVRIGWTVEQSAAQPATQLFIHAEVVGAGRFGGEVFATFVLVLAILAPVDTKREASIPVVVGTWVTTINRAPTDSYTGTASASVPPFPVAQLIGSLMAIAAARVSSPQRKAANV